MPAAMPAALSLLLLATTFASALPIELLGGQRQVTALADEYADAMHAAGLATPQEYYFTSRVNHYDNADTRTWQQRYFKNDQYWQPERSAPIFVQIGGEGALGPTYATLAIEMVQLASQFGALAVSLEHRFYGKSLPLPDLSSANLRYLSSQQALADAAFFVAYWKAQCPTCPVATFGCSYPGALASFFRTKFPHLTAVSVASSAPIHAVADFSGYLVQVTESIEELSGVQCLERIRAGVDEVQSMVAAGGVQKAEIESQFSVCAGSPSTWSANDVATFMSNAIVGIWQGAVQYDKETPVFNVDRYCTLMNSTLSPRAALAAVNTEYLRLNGASCALASYAETVRELQQVDASAVGVGARQWTFQTCNEFGYMQTTDSAFAEHPFGNTMPLSYYTQLCTDAFGYTFNLTTRVDETNTYYGGNSTAAAALGPGSIVYPNGSIDPWHRLSFLRSLPAKNISSVIIHDGAHCSNVFPNAPNAPPGVKPAQKQVAAFLEQQLGVSARAADDAGVDVIAAALVAHRRRRRAAAAAAASNVRAANVVY